jgi:hypothetical protein
MISHVSNIVQKKEKISHDWLNAGQKESMQMIFSFSWMRHGVLYVGI